MLPPCNGSSRRQSDTDRPNPNYRNSRDHNSFEPTGVLKSSAILVRQLRGHTHNSSYARTGSYGGQRYRSQISAIVGPAGFLFRYHTAVRRTVSVAYLA
jgi:hypothetical protein